MLIGGNDSTLNFVDCLFDNYTMVTSGTATPVPGVINTVSVGNGGVINLGNANLQITNCNFSNCTGKGHGGICEIG
jgi:hypothetical protein